MGTQETCVKELCSCDTFVALPPGTAHSCVVFGKNSDRPHDEIQEVVYVPAADHCCPSKLKCTYIEIEQVAHTHAVILSKPAWMWGAEMGANEHGVCIGNEAVWTKLNGPDDAIRSLLGMDLLRLGLERSTTALNALHVIVALLETHGQGGNCSDTISDFTYHNSFLIADCVEAWVLETAGKLWAAEQISKGVRNISNELSINTKIDLCSSNLKRHAEEHGFWDPSEGLLNFKKAYSLDEDDETEGYRYKCGKHLLNKFSMSGNFKEEDMFKILRDKPSGICMSSGSFISTGSQVSVIPPPQSTRTSCHWFTATPDPYHSVFKPFIFSDSIDFPMHVISPTVGINEDSLKVKNSFKEKIDRRHELFRLHGSALLKNKRSLEAFRSAKLNLEKKFVTETENMMSDCTSSKKLLPNHLFKFAVEEEIKLYE